MNKVATMDARERAELFAETAERKNLAEAIIEKDFWVCWVLKQLFSNKAFEGRLLFKGGTSLSKIFHAINRFSEDIDLAVDYVALGFTGDKDPRQENISKTKRNAILDEMMETCRGYIASEFLELLRKEEFRQLLKRATETTDSDTEGSEQNLKDQKQTPDETMRLAYREIETALAHDLLDRIREAPPAFFERLIVNLLVGMGYGGSTENAGRTLGRSDDDGVDGGIDQDALGLDRVSFSPPAR
jgi:Nucleotidyl transferase AbiEii toxin, Type IV TA system/Restriction endonuclease